MKNIRSVFTLLLVSLLTVSVATAQEKSNPKQKKKEKIVDHVKKNRELLALTPDQDTLFDAIMQKYANKKHELKNSLLSRQEKLEKVKIIYKERDAEVKLLLKDEQYQIYQKFEDERRSKMEKARSKQFLPDPEKKP